MDSASGTVTVISRAVPPAHGPKQVNVGAQPTQVVVSGDGQWAYVANSGATTVSRISVAAPDTATTFDVGGAPTALAVNRTGDDLYVLLDSAVVVAFEHSTTAPSRRGGQIAAGGSVGGMALTQGIPQRLLVAANSVTVIDAATFAQIDSYQPEEVSDPNVYNFAVGIAISSSADKPIAFVTYGSFIYGPIRFAATGGIAVIDVFAKTIKQIDLFSLPGPVALSADSALAFASVQYVWAETFYGAGFLPSSWVATLDTSTNLVSWTNLGGGTGSVYTPAGLSVSPDRSSVLVAVPNMGGVAVIDATTGLLSQDSILGLVSPAAVAFVPNASAPATASKIVATDDAPAGVVAASATTPAIADVLANDTIAGSKAVAGGNVQLTAATSLPTGISLDTAIGAVWVHAGAAAGVQTFGYQICEIAKPDNCATANVTLNVRAPYTITAGDDAATSVPGAVAIASVLANDRLNGAATSVADVSVVQTQSDPALTLDSGGAVAVSASASATAHSLKYRICENATPDNCSNEATVTVTVVNRAISAGDDAVTVSRVGGLGLLNVLTNDRFDGAAASGRVQFAAPAAAGGVSVDAFGTVSVAHGAAAGVQTLTYQICENGRPDNCATGRLVVTITPYVVSAAGDSGRGTSKDPSTAIANVLANDSLGDAAATTANVALSLVSVTPATDKIVLNTATGAVNVIAGANSVVYSLVYQICEIETPTNCASATATVSISGGGGGGRRR
ncbi:MAG TPA: Ig-like domain-containing protein [Vicinamibacterales bacterium]|nr:Ig-like domain-containing protein [Vicinamibacterales bacterium]